MANDVDKTRRCRIFAAVATLTVVVMVAVIALVVRPAQNAAASSGLKSGSDGVIRIFNPPAEDATMGTTSVESTCGLSTGTVQLNGRSFELYIPPTAPANAPLVLVWHGIASDPQVIEGKMQFKPIAAQEGVILAYPAGTGIPKAFNGAGCCAQMSLGTTMDDMQFGKDIIDHLTATHTCANPHNVFSTGFSNGGFMSHKLACEAGYRADGKPWIKAIAPHSGLQGGDYVCPYAQGPVPYFTFHADDDAVVGIDGTGTAGLTFKSLDTVTASWANENGCTAGFTTDNYGSSSTVCKKWTGCDVEECVVSGGLKHNWSGEPGLRASRPFDLDASRMIVSFFMQFVE